MKALKPSATALIIAKSQALLAERPAFSTLIGNSRAVYYRAFAGAARHTYWHPGRLGQILYSLLERISIPGIYLHYALRKHRIETIARNWLLKESSQQIVVIAAGCDPLAALLAREYTNASFFELDHPATQRVKYAALKRCGASENLRLIPLDLTCQSMLKVLHGTSFSPDIPTLFIAEGITMYLGEDEIAQFFRQIRACMLHADSRVLFTFMNRQRSGSIAFEKSSWLVNIWLWLKKEMFKWGIAPRDIKDFLSIHHLTPLDISDAACLRRHCLAEEIDGAPAIGEHVCLAKPA